MKNLFLFSLVFGFGLSSLSGQTLKSVSYSQLEKEINQYSGEYLILNFWATWCRPCVEELPDFEKINTEYKDSGVTVWLVNLDFKSALDKKVIPFIQKNGITSRIFHLEDTDPNEWINKVDESWGGNIPVTVIYKKGGKTHFWARPTDYKELKTSINQ